jgi:hypothetical protein
VEIVGGCSFEVGGMMGEHEVQILAAVGRKGEPKNQAKMKDDTNIAQEDKQFSPLPLSLATFGFSIHFSSP